MIDFDKIRQLYKFGKEISFKDAQILLKHAKRISFEKKKQLITAGSKKNAVFFIQSGLVRCFVINEKGEDITFAVFKENQVVSNMDMILFQQPSKYNYEALEPTKTFSMDFQIFDDLISKNPKLEANRKLFFRTMMKRVLARLESLVLLTPEQRYIQFVEDHPGLVHRVQDKYIAHILGITPVSLSRIRKRIAEKK